MADEKEKGPAAAEPEKTVENTEASEQTVAEGQKPANGKGPTMAIKVYAPFKIYYEGDALSITAENETGPFDILPRHHNFLCMLVPCDLIIRTPFDTKTVRISRALMHVKAEKVTVFVDV